MRKFSLLVIVLALLSAFGVGANAEDILIMEDTCETEIENAALLEGAPDGSKYYHIENGIDIGFLPWETSSDYLYEMDIRFNNEGCGFSLMKNGKWNSCIRVKDGNFALQTGGNSFTKYVPIDFSKWYHLTFLGRTNRDANSVTYGHIILEEYDDSGKRVNRQVFNNVNLRNNAATHYINAFGVDIDNLRAYSPSPTSLTLTADGESVIAGGGLQFAVTAFWNDLEMNGINSSMIDFAVYDSENLYPTENENITISPSGVFETKPLTPAQTVHVRVKSKSSDLSDSLPIKIISGDVFTVKGVGINDAKTRLTELTVNKNFASYKDSVTFVAAFYNSDGAFNTIGAKTLYGSNIAEGEVKIPLGVDVPQGFDWNAGKVKIFVITTLTGADKAIAVKLAREELPSFDSAATVITIKEDKDISDVKSEDILYFEVVNQGEAVTIPQNGKTYVFSSVNKIDTLYEIK